ncbi:MAG: TonB-dependent receptor [Bryobacterales bacterium]|nr:TonB-dependent receptor [Bryobacterales bacterium]
MPSSLIAHGASRFTIILRLSVAMATLCLAAHPAWAQLYSGTLTGVVTDPSGAVVPAVAVTVVDTGKGTTYTATTDTSGRYLVRALPPSTYNLSVEATGFKNYLSEGIVIAVNQNASLDVGLTLGTGSQSVDVSESATALATQDSSTGQELNRTFINELPLLGRGVFDLAGLAPGITQPSGGFKIAYYSTNFISNGSRSAQTDVVLDGVSTSSYEADGIIPLYQPSVDAVQEFKVQQSGFSADMGFTASTVMNVVTRSGSNTIHGSLSWFLRNNALTANNWFANANNQPLAARRYNRMGGTLGGPIKKDKTFYFANIEGLIDRSPVTFQGGVPSEAMRKGDFSEICAKGFSSSGMCADPNGQLWDPYTGIYNPGLGVPVRTGYIPFNNLATYMSPGSPRLNGTSQQLPARPGNLIDPVAAKLMTYFPKPNVNVGQPNYNRKNNWFSTGAASTEGYQFDTKLDHVFTTRDRSNLKVSRQSGQFSGTNPYGNIFAPTVTGPAVINATLASFNHTHVLSPATLLSVSYGFTRQFTDQRDVATNFDEDPITLLGLPDYMRSSGFKTSPAVAINSYASPMGANIGSLPYLMLRRGLDTHDLNGSLSRIQGRHELKAGGGMRMHRTNFVQPGNPGGLFAFTYFSTAQYYYAGGGDDMASFLTGVGYGPPSSYAMPAWVSTQNFAFSGFLQDNWRVSDRFTLNLGVRYDIETPRTERYNRQSFIDLDMPSPLQAPGMPNLKGGMQFVDNNNRHTYGWDGNNWAPRIGFAYKLNEKTVVRGGYGIFFTSTIRGAAGSGSGTQGFSRNTPWITNYMGDGQTPCCRLSDPFPGTGPLMPTGASLGAMSFVGDAIPGAPARSSILNATPYEQTWTASFQRELGGGFLADVTYLGKRGTKLYFGGTGDVNHLGSEVEHYTPAQLADLATMVKNPFYGIVPATAPLGTPTITKGQLQRPYPQYTRFSTVPWPVASSSFNAMQLKLEKRFSNGFQMLGTYSWSKSMDDASVGSLSWMAGIGTSLQNPNDRRAEHSLSSFDIPQVLGLSYVYELPFGRGKAVGSNWNAALNAILGGWKTNGIWRFSSGQPLALSFRGSQPLPTYGAQRPNLSADLVKTGAEDFRKQYFANPEVAAKPAPYTLGNAPRTLASVRSPGVNSANLSLMKSFDFALWRENMKVELRAEAFNAFNHPQFCGPNTTIDSGSFGQIWSTCNDPRELQLGLRIYW